MTQEEFEIIIKPLGLLDEEQMNFLKGALLGNFLNWEKAKEKKLSLIMETPLLFEEYKMMLYFKRPDGKWESKVLNNHVVEHIDIVNAHIKYMENLQ